MELKIWSKTLLNIYGCLFKLADEIDKIVYECGISSAFKFGLGMAFIDAQKMIELTERKINIINIKVLIEKSLLGLDDLSCKILTLKFIDKMSNETIMEALSIKRRTYFRKYINAISAFSNQLLINGYDSNELINLTSSESWIAEIYKEFYRKEMSKKAEENLTNYSIISMAVKDLSALKNYSYFC